MTSEDLRERILARYEIDEFCEVLEITMEDLLDSFLDKVYNNVNSLDVLGPGESYDEESDSPGSAHTEVQEEDYP